MVEKYSAFIINLGIRLPDIESPTGFSIALSGIAIALLVVSGWIGAEMVHVHRLGVSETVTPSLEGGSVFAIRSPVLSNLILSFSHLPPLPEYRQ